VHIAVCTLVISGMMLRMVRSAWLVAFAVSVAVAAGGCTKSGTAPNLSSAVTVTAASSTVATRPPSSAPPVPDYPADVPLTGHNVKPGEKPPRYPATAAARSQAGANAFAEFYLRTLDWAYATTNPAYMKHYTGPTCGLCNGIATGISKTAAAHHWYEGGRLTIRKVTAEPKGAVTAPADFCALSTVEETAFTTVDKTGRIFTGDGSHANDRIKLCMTQGPKWQVSFMAGAS
jgi:hypothetical protein